MSRAAGGAHCDRLPAACVFVRGFHETTCLATALRNSGNGGCVAGCHCAWSGTHGESGPGAGSLSESGATVAVTDAGSGAGTGAHAGFAADSSGRPNGEATTVSRAGTAAYRADTCAYRSRAEAVCHEGRRAYRKNLDPDVGWSEAGRHALFARERSGYR